MFRVFENLVLPLQCRSVSDTEKAIVEGDSPTELSYLFSCRKVSCSPAIYQISELKNT